MQMFVSVDENFDSIQKQIDTEVNRPLTTII